MRTEKQKDKIREHLLSGKTITSLDALKLYGCFRLASRIADLKQEGMGIRKRMVKIEDSYYAEYYLA